MTQVVQKAIHLAPAQVRSNKKIRVLQKSYKGACLWWMCQISGIGGLVGWPQKSLCQHRTIPHLSNPLSATPSSHPLQCIVYQLFKGKILGTVAQFKCVLPESQLDCGAISSLKTSPDSNPLQGVQYPFQMRIFFRGQVEKV